MSRKPQLRSVATAPATSAVSSSSAAFVAPSAALAPASPPEPTRSPCRALLGPRPLIDGEDGTNYDVILERISAADGGRSWYKNTAKEPLGSDFVETN